jgi:hypothetical protein
VATTTAAVHEVECTPPIQEALVGLGLSPGEHLVDAGFVTAELLVDGREEHGVRLIGPPRKDASRQNRTDYRERGGPPGVRAARRDRGDALPGVRSHGPRRARYRSAEKAHLQNVATAVAINFSRGSAWFEGEPLAATWTSRFVLLAALNSQPLSSHF